jgi:DNA-binding transcriptional MerR regulator
MDTYSISQAARRSGFPASTLRYYEREGLLLPDRTAAGYRSYDEHHVELLGFIGRAKGFGLTLAEITELLALLDEDRCEPVQDRLRALIGDKLTEARARVIELTAFTAELERVARALDEPATDGPCGAGCACLAADPAPTEPIVPIACTLPSEAMGERTREWRRLLDAATTIEHAPRRVRVRFDRDVELGPIVTLTDAEQRCCRFFTFTLTIGDDSVTLDIEAPPEAIAMLDELLVTNL